MELYYMTYYGAVAQLARASHWQCEGREFESLLLHHDFPSSSLSCFFSCRLPSKIDLKRAFRSAVLET